MRRLLRALHFSPEEFKFFEASGAPHDSSIALIAGSSFLLPSTQFVKGANGNIGSLGLHLAHQIAAPPCITLRLNTLSPHCPWPWGQEEAMQQLRSVLGADASLRSHEVWPDVITVVSSPPKGSAPQPRYPTVFTTARGGEAVLRGSHLEADDIFATIPEAPNLRKGSKVSVFASSRDIESTTNVAEQFTSLDNSEAAVISEIVDRLVHTRYVQGASGRPADSIFVGNGIWLPPWGVQMTEGFLRPMPLPARGNHKILRVRGRVVSPGGAAYQHGLASQRARLPEGLLPQSLPSVAAIQILDPQPGERILDLCAAPGGKTQHAAQLMRNIGSIIAVEANERRYERMRRFMYESGARIVECVHGDGTLWKSKQRGARFDRVIVDAPCSSTGLWPRLDWKRVTREGVSRLAEQQFALLSTAAQEVRIGGIVVYSVCSYLPQETLAVCNRALSELPLELDEVKNGTRTEFADGSDRTSDSDAMGFFIIRFRRIQDTGEGITFGGARRRKSRIGT